LEDVSKYPALFDKLSEEGLDYEPWTRDELQKLAGLNLIRVMKAVENVRDSLRSEKPYEGLVPYDDLIVEDPDIPCRMDPNNLKPTSSVQFSKDMSPEL
jgi:membrane dipeptidase